MKIADRKITISNERWSDEEFENERKKVLAIWPTGKEVDLQDAIEFHKSLPASKNYAKEVQKGKLEGRTLVQPKGGVALLDEHIQVLKCLQDEGEADLLPTTIDSYTRNLKFDLAKAGLEMSIREGRSMLNGLPVVNHGVRKIRKIIEVMDRPVILLSGTPFPQLIAEVALAAGYTAFLGAGITYPTSYIKDLPIEQGIRNFQYLDRLTSFYAEHGILIHREQPGFLTATLIPPGVAIAIAVMEMLLAAGQGLKYYCAGLCQNMDFYQDIAALRVLEELCHEYVKRLGYDDMFFSTRSHQWMQAFPQDEAKSYAVIVMGSVIAAMGGATQITTKTIHEYAGVPTKEANAAGARATKMAIKMVRNRRMPLDENMKAEMRIIRMEATSIIDKTLELGDGDIAKGAVMGFAAGVIDVPWAPNIHSKGKVIPIRDAQGAVRYLDFGNLPFNKEVREYNNEKLSEREKKQGKKLDYEAAIYDITEIAQAL